MNRGLSFPADGDNVDLDLKLPVGVCEKDPLKPTQGETVLETRAVSQIDAVALDPHLRELSFQFFHHGRALILGAIVNQDQLKLLHVRSQKQNDFTDEDWENSGFVVSWDNHGK